MFIKKLRSNNILDGIPSNPLFNSHLFIRQKESTIDNDKKKLANNPARLFGPVTTYLSLLFLLKC